MSITIEPVTETVVIKSITDQILELPIESVVLATRPSGTAAALHRTGRVGWLATRGHRDRTTRGICGYMDEAAVRAWVAELEKGNYTFELIHNGYRGND